MAARCLKCAHAESVTGNFCDDPLEREVKLKIVYADRLLQALEESRNPETSGKGSMQ